MKFINGSSSSPHSCTSSSSSSSSSSSLHSTISTHSLTSSTSSSSSPLTSPRCPGLDLLVKAVSHVSSGSSVAFPYIQRRVIRRRKPASRFTQFIVTSQLGNPPPHLLDHHIDDGGDEVDCRHGSKVLVVVDHQIKKQKRRSKPAPSKYNDSVLQSVKPKDRKKRRSSKV